MSALIHTKDHGVMIPNKTKNLIKCSKCGYKVNKSQIHQKYTEGVLGIPI